MNKILKALIASTVLLAANSLFAANKSDLKILYVGNNPETVQLSGADKMGGVGDRVQELKKSRLPSFQKFLSDHFKTVDVVFSIDYSEDMSDKYQVTIFGDVPKAIKERVLEVDEKTGQTLKYEPAQYLTKDFDSAAIVIADVSPRIGEPLEYKMDWLCLCLDAHAHGMKMDHPIFNTPVKVNLTMEQRPTPENYKHYYNGRDLEDSMPMWRVQREGYMDGKGYPPGLVSTGLGYVDATDSEVISNGVCAKSVDSVALARHGNFFHWGFSAKPDDMTEQGRQVFLNAIHYIAKFDGQKPYSKRQYRKQGREVILDRVHFTSQNTYENYVEGVASNYNSRKDSLEKAAEAGRNLSFADKRFLKSEPPKPLGREEWMQQDVLSRWPKELVAKFGADFDKYMGYYQENMEFLMPGEQQYSFVVDVDAKALSISNRSPELLDRCIALLEKGEDMERAKRLLSRYTDEKFISAKEWRNWYNQNKYLFFFSDVGGFKFSIMPSRASK
ncbi:hypothetical protein QP938_12005 [Porticoccaceae bacterium LTM1]|nr:hypothetical protein QP938_12005 [Porticoccaceae bacterium LTM1]